MQWTQYGRSFLTQSNAEFVTQESPTPPSPPNWDAQSSWYFKLPSCGAWVATASSPTTITMWPTLASMAEREVRFLGQVRLEMQNINEEMKRFISQLDKLGELLNEHRLDIEDLQSSLMDYEKDWNGSRASARLNNNQVNNPAKWPTQG
jgi:hypothetical protein